MFGYITTNEEELRIREYRRYQAYYCGTCKSLKKDYGPAAQLTLTYDMSFVGLLLTALYEDETAPKKVGCLVHPLTRHEALLNEYTAYAAAMNVLLSYYKCEDDWTDEKKFGKKLAALALKHSVKKAGRKFPEQAQAIRDYIEAQKKAEAEGETDADSIADLTGRMMGRLLVYRKDVWSDALYRMGFFLGKFIYIMDAFDDLEKDRKKGSFNPLLAHSGEEDFEKKVKELLTDLAAESARAFETLPILTDAELLRNIIYSGMWSRYERILIERHKVE